MYKKTDSEQGQHKEILCNVCGQPIRVVGHDKLEDHLCVNKKWNYFSAKDLTVHSFVVCEMCYDKWVQSFAIPITEEEVEEVFDFPDL